MPRSFCPKAVRRKAVPAASIDAAARNEDRRYGQRYDGGPDTWLPRNHANSRSWGRPRTRNMKTKRILLLASIAAGSLLIAVLCRLLVHKPDPRTHVNLSVADIRSRLARLGPGLTTDAACQQLGLPIPDIVQHDTGESLPTYVYVLSDDRELHLKGRNETASGRFRPGQLVRVEIRAFPDPPDVIWPAGEAP